MAWDDAKKAKVVEMYEAENPTPENSVQIVKQIAEKVGETPNGVRMVLSKAEVYVKASTPTSTTKKDSSKAGEEKAPRVGKADKIERLSRAIAATGMSPDNEILEKLTGKAADYFATVIETLSKAMEDGNE